MLGEGGPGRLPKCWPWAPVVLGQTLAGQARAMGAWAALSRDSGGNRMGISGDGLWGTEARSEPGTRRAWGPGCVVGIARSPVGSSRR